MKLRNKKTGEIGNLALNINPNKESYSVLSTENGDTVCGNLVIADYNSLAELNEDWEDYEEPKKYWCVDCDGMVLYEKDENDDYDIGCRKIGNYFETKEEAEKAVEKLKAWKRLKDFGCGFMLDDHFTVKFVGPDARKITSAEEQKSLSDSYKLLFGGE